MRDIAREVGVSQALVSLVFRGQPGASAETRQSIFEAADRLGYVRNESARSLRSGTPVAIGVLFRVNQPFHAEILPGLYTAAAESSHSLILSAVSDDRSEQTAVRELVAHRCGAIILIGPRSSDEELRLAAGGLPLIVVARKSELPQIDWVMSDDLQAMTDVLDCLYGLGHRNITFLTSEGDAGARDREEAFAAAAGALGLAHSVWVVNAGITEAAGVAAVEKLLEDGPLPSAMIAFNDRCALGALEALSEHSVSVPEEVSLVGFDDSEVASRSTTMISSVHQDVTEIAQVAVSRAVARMRRSTAQSEHGDETVGVLVPTYLVKRSTIGPARVN